MSSPRQVVPGRVYLVTRRCAQRQFLLRPDDETNNAFVYCLAYAAKCARIKVVAFIASSNHYHAVVIDLEGRIPDFLERFHRLLAKHQNALRGRWENFWSSEQTSLVELVEPDDVLAKVTYTLANPVKDHLVERAHHWPGASSLAATPVEGSIGAHRPRHFFRRDGAMPEHLEIALVRAPGFEHLTPTQYAESLGAGMAKAESDAAVDRNARGFRVLGRKAILAQSPTDQPDSVEIRRRLHPRVAAKGHRPRVEALERLRLFRCAYRAAREAWLKGLDVLFPEGTWWLKKFAAVACAGSTASTS